MGEGPQNIGAHGEEGETLITVDGLVSGGRGVGRDAGRVWFVRGGLPGDRVWARAERVRPRFVEAAGLRLQRPSPLRRVPPCPHQARCGGCPWMPLEERVQREWKRRLVHDALTRIAGIEAPVVEPVEHPSDPLGYRSRLELSAGAGPDGRPAIGLWGRVDGSPALVDLPACPLQTPAANVLLGQLRAVVAARPGIGRQLVEQGPFRVLIRFGAGRGGCVGLWGAEHPFPGAAEIASALSSQPHAPESVVALRARPGRRGGVRAEALHGSPTIRERLGELEFELSPASFVQVNPAGGEALLRLVRACAGPVEQRRILDLFGGVGVFGLHLARLGARHVVICDADREAVATGRRAARAAGLARASFVHRTARAYLQSRQGETFDLVVANPPRSGFGRGVAQGILALRAARVIVVSCDPPTLARDIEPFLDAGYGLARVVPVDLFPQTHHVETVLLLERGGSTQRVRP